MDEAILDLRKQLLESAVALENRLEALAEADLAKPMKWRESDFTVRFMMARLAAHAQDHANQVRKTRRALGVPASEAQMILAQFLAAEAALLSETVGLTAEEFERAPAAGEWSVKQVLEHILTVQKRNLDMFDAVLAPTEKA